MLEVICFKGQAHSKLKNLKVSKMLSDFLNFALISLFSDAVLSIALKLSDIDLLTVTSGGMRLDNLGADPPIGSRIMLTF